MNHRTHSSRFVRRARVVAALLAGFFWVPVLRAQPAAPAVENRCLLIFDTSSAMKKCLPALQSSVNRLFLSDMNGQLQPGDSMGVWTFATDVRPGQFPLQSWQPEAAATIASNITAFLTKQHYAKSTRFDAVMPLLNGVVQNSERLTVLIFCDGDGEIHDTPYDDAINVMFRQYKLTLQKARQPFIVVLRSQIGQYVGSTVNSSTTRVNFPEFPPAPRPPAPPPPPQPANQPPPQPLIEAPPLVIIGTKVGTNLPPPAPPNPPPVATNPPPVAPPNPPPAIESNPPAPVEPLKPTNAISAPMNAAGQTNVAVAPPENSGLGSHGALAIGAALLVLAGALAAWMLVRGRGAGQPSLITRSMQKDENPPPKT